MAVERTSRKRAPNLTREEWLQRAFELLPEGKLTPLRIDSLTKAIGVTKGSFYWHFRDRQDFIDQLVGLWKKTLTAEVKDEVRNLAASPSDRLLYFLELATDEKRRPYDLALRAWGISERNVARHVEEIDKCHLGLVCSLFEEMGFDPKDAECRGQMFYAWTIGDKIVPEQCDASDSEEHRRKFHQLMTAGAGS